jgi:hypothetical protein
LLFIYLEIGAMVGIYFKTTRLPVRYLLYIAITALARVLIEMVSAEHRTGARFQSNGKSSAHGVLLAGSIQLSLRRSALYPRTVKQTKGQFSFKSNRGNRIGAPDEQRDRAPFYNETHAG